MLMVFDMNASLNFYVDTLGFEIHESAGEKDDVGWVWLKRNDLNLMLNTQYEMPDRPPQPEASRASVHRDTILYLGCPDVDAAYHELVGKGLKCDPPEVAPYGMKQLYLHDPDGYGICFQWPTLVT
jgi:catechol 2,3-dioxygenase-like lactoylglutathione lyase family enzyme